MVTGFPQRNQAPFCTHLSHSSVSPSHIALVFHAPRSNSRRSLRLKSTQSGVVWTCCCESCVNGPPACSPVGDLSVLPCCYCGCACTYLLSKLPVLCLCPYCGLFFPRYQHRHSHSTAFVSASDLCIWWTACTWHLSMCLFFICKLKLLETTSRFEILFPRLVLGIWT